MVVVHSNKSQPNSAKNFLKMGSSSFKINNQLDCLLPKGMQNNDDAGLQPTFQLSFSSGIFIGVAYLMTYISVFPNR